MKSEYDLIPAFDERLTVALPRELKAAVFTTAAKRKLPASILIREALEAITREPAAA